MGRLPNTHPGRPLLTLVAAITFSFLGSLALADDPKTETKSESENDSSGAAIAPVVPNNNTVLGVGNQVGTVTSSNLRGQAALEEALGKESYFRSLSAINLQKAIDEHLSNERERIESYYEMREYRDEHVAATRHHVDEETAIRRAKEAAPKRLTSQQYDPKTGKIHWPKPLDDEVLKPYTKVIDMNFAKRSDLGHKYGGGEARMVERMIKLIQKAVDSIKPELTPREYVALSNYLGSIHHEAMYDLAGNRVINE